MKQWSIQQMRLPSPLSKTEEAELLSRMDDVSFEKLILHNLRLVSMVAHDFRLTMPVEDAFSIGYFGLWRGIKTYKVNGGASLANYCIICIKRELLAELRKQNRRTKDTVSLDTEFFVTGKEDDEGSPTLEDALADPRDPIEEMLTEMFDHQYIEIIRKFIRELDDRKKFIFTSRIEDKKSFAELGPMLGISKQRAGILYKDAILEIKHKIALYEKRNLA